MDYTFQTCVAQLHTHTEGERDRDRWRGGNLLEGIDSSDCGG